MWSIKTNSPYSQLRNLQREINDLFGGFSGEAKFYPRVNIYDSGNEIRVLAELPGFAKDEININVLGNHLSLEAERKETQENDENNQIHRKEIVSGKFMRSFNLPYEVNQKNVKAKLKNGILEITLPRCEQSMPKKINVISE